MIGFWLGFASFMLALFVAIRWGVHVRDQKPAPKPKPGPTLLPPEPSRYVYGDRPYFEGRSDINQPVREENYP